MKLVAEILTGTLFYVEVDEDASVGDLKKEIAKQQKLPLDRLIIILDADQQQQQKQNCLLDKVEVGLKEYGVQDGSHIYVFFEPLSRDDGAALPKSPFIVSSPSP